MCLIGSAFSPPMFLHNIGKTLDAPDFFDQHRESQPISTASTTVTANIKPLERRRLVTTRVDREDRRNRRLELKLTER